MRIDNKKVATPSEHGVESTESFKMRLSDTASPHLIRLLIDQYSDGVAASIREYSSNAADAHALAGKSDVPIEVSLPTNDSPVLRIRDYGTGLSLDELDIYVSMGDSTKQNDNTQTGAFGLGCKSGLSVSDHFYVVSTHEGTRRFCRVGGDANGELRLEVLKKTESSEGNGVEIRLPIPESQVSSTREKAEEFFEYWDRGTVIVDGEQPKNWLDKVMSYQTFTTESGTIAYHPNFYRSVLVSMGNVAYKVELDKLDGVLDDNWEFSDLKFATSVGILLYADIGSLHLVPSRDSLVYDEHTVSTIRRLLNELRNEVERQMVERLEKTTSYTEAEEILVADKQFLKEERFNALNPNTFDIEYSPYLNGISYNDTEKLEKMRKDQQIPYDVEPASLRILHGSARDSLGSRDIEINNPISRSQPTKQYSIKPFYTGNNGSLVRHVLWFKPDDYPKFFSNFKFTSVRAKIRDWMTDQGITNVTLVAGYLDTTNPWVFENDNVVITSAVDMEDRAKEIRAERRKREAELRKIRGEEKKHSAGNAKEETKYTVHGRSRPSFGRVEDMPLSEVANVVLAGNEQKFAVYSSADQWINGPLRNIASKLASEKDDTVYIEINGSRTTKKFLQRAAKLGIETISETDFIEEKRRELAKDDNTLNVIAAGRILEKIQSDSGMLSSLALEMYRPSRNSPLSQIQNRILNTTFNGVTVGHLVDQLSKAADTTGDSVLNFSEAEVLLRGEEEAQSIIEERSKLFIPSQESLTEHYPMIRFVRRSAFSRSIGNEEEVIAVLDYVDMMNEMRRNENEAS